MDSFIQIVVLLASFEWILQTSSMLSARKKYSSLFFAFFTISSQNSQIVYLLCFHGSCTFDHNVFLKKLHIKTEVKLIDISYKTIFSAVLCTVMSGGAGSKCPVGLRLGPKTLYILQPHRPPAPDIKFYCKIVRWMGLI